MVACCSRVVAIGVLVLQRLSIRVMRSLLTRCPPLVSATVGGTLALSCACCSQTVFLITVVHASSAFTYGSSERVAKTFGCTAVHDVLPVKRKTPSVSPPTSSKPAAFARCSLSAGVAGKCTPSVTALRPSRSPRPPPSFYWPPCRRVVRALCSPTQQRETSLDSVYAHGTLRPSFVSTRFPSRTRVLYFKRAIYKQQKPRSKQAKSRGEERGRAVEAVVGEGCRRLARSCARCGPPSSASRGCSLHWSSQVSV